MRLRLCVSVTILAILLAPSFGVCQTPSQEMSPCGGPEADATPTQQVASCTVLIRATTETLSKSMAMRGNAYRMLRLYDLAIEDFDKATQLDSAYAKAFYDRGLTHGAKEEYGLAIRDFDEAIRLNPNDSNAFSMRGYSYYNQKEFDLAVQDYDEAIRLDPSYPGPFLNRGLVHYERGEYDRAKEDYDAAIRVNPNFSLAFNNRGNVYRAKRDYDRALQDYDEAIKLHPDFALALGNRGEIERLKGSYALALRDFSEVLRLAPGNFEAARTRGITNFYLNKMDDSAKDLGLAVQVNSTDSYSAIWLYLARARGGKDGKAELEQAAGAISLEDWPGQVISLYLGRLTEDTAKGWLTGGEWKTDKSRLCEASFYLGEYFLLRGKRKEALRLFRDAIATESYADFEYAGAQVELRRALGH